MDYDEYDPDVCEECGCHYDSELYIGCPHCDGSVISNRS